MPGAVCYAIVLYINSDICRANVPYKNIEKNELSFCFEKSGQLDGAEREGKKREKRRLQDQQRRTKRPPSKGEPIKGQDLKVSSGVYFWSYSPFIFTFEASRHSQRQRHYIAVRQGVENNKKDNNTNMTPR